MPDGKSFSEHLMKIGSNDARMRWGIGRSQARAGLMPHKEEPHTHTDR